MVDTGIQLLRQMGYYPNESVANLAAREGDAFIPESGHSMLLDEEDLIERGPALFLRTNSNLLQTHGILIGDASDEVTQDRRYILRTANGVVELSHNVDSESDLEGAIAMSLLVLLNEWSRSRSSRWRWFLRSTGNDSVLTAVMIPLPLEVEQVLRRDGYQGPFAEAS